MNTIVTVIYLELLCSCHDVGASASNHGLGPHLPVRFVFYALPGLVGLVVLRVLGSLCVPTDDGHGLGHIYLFVINPHFIFNIFHLIDVE